LAPVTFRGQAVWVGQISRDIGVKLARKTLVTHAIDPMVDEACLFVLLDMAASRYLGRIGFVEGVGKATREQPRFNYTGDDYYPGGLRAVLFISDQPNTYQDIEWLDWALLPSGLNIELGAQTLSRYLSGAPGPLTPVCRVVGTVVLDATASADSVKDRRR
jgi:hypothetical protein